jgi:nucleoredoxin
MALRKLLGVDHVQRGKDEVAVSTLEGKVTLLYFGASWCGPCKQFSPILAKLYKSLKAEKKEFEVIFISSDQSQEAFDEYRKDHPWLSLPFSQRKAKDKISRKLRVSTIPTVAILDKLGRVASTKGRQLIMQDQEGKEFPWIPKSLWEILGEGNLQYNDERTVAPSILKAHDGVAVYFTAHWSPPCRAFTPRLASVYRKLKARGTNFEIIFVPLDQAVEEYAEYFSEMPWPGLPLGDKRTQELIEALGVETIPALVTVKPDGTVINKEAKEVADEDEDAQQFPWAAVSLPPVCALNPSQAVVQALNNSICAVLSINGAPNRQTALIEFNKAVDVVTRGLNAGLEQEDRVRFLIVDDEDDSHVMLYRKVLSAMGVATPKHGEPTVLLMNLPNDRATKFVNGELSADNIVKCVTDFKKLQDTE